MDFSSVALRKAERRAQEAGVDATFVKGDVTADTIPGVEGPFGLLLDYGTLDDLRGDARQRMAALMTRIAAPGGRCLVWCFFAPRSDLPRISLRGPSRMAPAIEPGEMEERFGTDWEIEELAQMTQGPGVNAFLMTRRG